MNQCTDKIWSLLTFWFDNLNVQYVMTFEIDCWIFLKYISLFYAVIRGKLNFPERKWILLSISFLLMWKSLMVISIFNHSNELSISWFQKLIIMIILRKWLNSCIWGIDGGLTGTTTPGQNEPVKMTIKEYFPFPKAPGLEPHHQMQFSILPRIPLEEYFTCYHMIKYFSRWKYYIKTSTDVF